MKAYIHKTYGSPDVLKSVEEDIPQPKENEVLIKVHAASLNAADRLKLRGEPGLFRLFTGLSKPKNTGLGKDIAGTVEKVGVSVSNFNVGDTVFGEVKDGAFREFYCVNASTLAHKPDGLSFKDASGIPLAGQTAVQALEAADLKAGQSILINGGSGGVGTFTVQLAKQVGAEITAVCSTRNVERVKSLGANHVIDYTQMQLSDIESTYDVVIDNVGNMKSADFKHLLNPKGTGIAVGFKTFSNLFSVILGDIMGSTTLKTITGKPNVEHLNHLASLVESNEIKTVVDKIYPLSELPDAMAYLETGRVRGKVIITILD